MADHHSTAGETSSPRQGSLYSPFQAPLRISSSQKGRTAFSVIITDANDRLVCQIYGETAESASGKAEALVAPFNREDRFFRNALGSVTITEAHCE